MYFGVYAEIVEGNRIFIEKKLTKRANDREYGYIVQIQAQPMYLQKFQASIFILSSLCSVVDNKMSKVMSDGEYYGLI